MFGRTHHEPTGVSLATRAATGGLALAAALAACGGSGSSGQEAQQKHASGNTQAPSAVLAAYDKTTGAGTVTVSAESSKSGKSGKKLSGKATLDFENEASSTTMNVPDSPETQTRTLGNTLYQKVPKKKRKQVPGKKPWVKMDLAQIAKAQYGDKAGKVTDDPPADPFRLLAYLHGITKAKKSGTATVRGDDTTRYKATVDLRKAGKGRGPQIQQQLTQMQQQVGKSTLPVSIWLDSDDKVRRLQTTLPTGGKQGGKQGGTQGASANITLTENFYDYGESADISAPAEEKTADVTKQQLQRLKQQQMMQKRRQKMQQKKLQQKLQEQQQKKQNQQKQGGGS